MVDFSNYLGPRQAERRHGGHGSRYPPKRRPGNPRSVQGSLTPSSIYRRFFSPKKELSDAELKQLTDVDFQEVMALVVTARRTASEILLGGGRLATEGGDHPQSAELAFLTAGAQRGRGIASLLLRHLTRLGREAGLSRPRSRCPCRKSGHAECVPAQRIDRSCSVVRETSFT